MLVRDIDCFTANCEMLRITGLDNDFVRARTIIYIEFCLCGWSLIDCTHHRRQLRDLLFLCILNIQVCLARDLYVLIPLTKRSTCCCSKTHMSNSLCTLHSRERCYKRFWLVFVIQRGGTECFPVYTIIFGILNRKIVDTSPLPFRFKPDFIYRSIDGYRRFKVTFCVPDRGRELMFSSILIYVACRGSRNTYQYHYVCLCRTVFIILLLIQMPDSITFGRIRRDGCTWCISGQSSYIRTIDLLNRNRVICVVAMGGSKRNVLHSVLRHGFLPCVAPWIGNLVLTLLYRDIAHQRSTGVFISLFLEESDFRRTCIVSGDFIGSRIIGDQLRTIIQCRILKIRFVYRVVEIIRQIIARVRSWSISESIVRSLRFVHLDNIIFAIGCSNIFLDSQSNRLLACLKAVRCFLPDLDCDCFICAEHLLIALAIRNNDLVVCYVVVCNRREITTGLNLSVTILCVTNIRYLLFYESLKCRIGNSHCVRALTYAHYKLIRHFIIIIRLSLGRTNRIVAYLRCRERATVNRSLVGICANDCVRYITIALNRIYYIRRLRSNQTIQIEIRIRLAFIDAIYRHFDCTVIHGYRLRRTKNSYRNHASIRSVHTSVRRSELHFVRVRVRVILYYLCRISPSPSACNHRILHTAQCHFRHSVIRNRTIIQRLQILNLRSARRRRQFRRYLANGDSMRRYKFLRHSISRLISTNSRRSRTAKRHYTCIRNRNNICRIGSRCRERKVCIIYRCRSLQRYLISCIVNIFNIPRL